MKRIAIGLAAIAFVAFANVASAAERTVVFAVKNMTCAACPFIVKKSMASVAGVVSVKVSYKDRTATVRYDDSKTTPRKIGAASGNAGFPATPKKSAS